MQSLSRLPFKQASAAEIKQRLDAGEQLHIIDVRERDEHIIAHIEQAKLHPMSEMRSWWQELPRDEAIVVMCHHGSRSAQVCMALREAGFGDLTNMQGGIDAWSREVDPGVPRY